MQFNAFLKKSLSVLMCFVMTFSFLLSPVFSDDITDLQSQVDQKNTELKQQQQQLDQIKKDIDSINQSALSVDEKIRLMNDEITKIDGYVKVYSDQIKVKEDAINKKQTSLDAQAKEFDSLAQILYKKSRVSLFDLIVLSFEANQDIKELLFNQILISRLSNQIKLVSQDYAQLKDSRSVLEDQKKQLDDQEKSLAKSKSDLLAQKNGLLAQASSKNGTKSKVQGQITLLKNQISDLQAAILLAKSGSATTSVGDVPVSGDYNSTLAGFQAKAPAGSFGIFSFGAYTHRMGMSQYGAKARADAGQSYTTILKAYYGKSPTTVTTTGNINVQGYGNMDFETRYLYGIAEMPSNWNLNALKAQAIAARTYAYKYYANHWTICITEQCQVWNPSKANAIATIPLWKQAVDETKGQILQGVTTYYSSTSGGYLTTSGWDTTNGTGGSGSWTSNAWESKAGSSWFYKAWYRSGYSDTSSSCGRMPWMTTAEMSDILNTYLVIKGVDLKGSYDSSRILPITINTCSVGGASGNPYSMNDMKNLLNTPVTTVIGKPIVTNNNSGVTTNIAFATNRGVINISGVDFQETFNIRAPGFLAIPQSGYVFINIEKK